MIESAALIRRLYDAALAAVDPMTAVESRLRLSSGHLEVDQREIPVAGRLMVVGAGKAAVPMALGVERVCGDRIAAGIVVTKEGHATGRLPDRIGVREAGHPIPDERGVEATRQILALASSAGADDVVIALISGGGSALLEAPRPPVTLQDMAATTDLLLRAGAPIQDLNAVRIPLSLVKGGGLRQAAEAATMVTLILSDVLGNDPRVIASGPTVPGGSTAAEAVRVLERYGVTEQVPETVRGVLQDHVSDMIESRSWSSDAVVVIADNAHAVEAAAAAAHREGLRPTITWQARTGEASALGREWVATCAEAPDDVDVLLGGGEATVTVRGDGVGGRNTEFALAAALALADRQLAGWVVASLATDGEDAMTGVAGAIADAATEERSRRGGVDPAAALDQNDSLRVFEAAGGIVDPGPSGTNVNDLYLAVRYRS
jgi:hydroxypyruvate reductase